MKSKLLIFPLLALALVLTGCGKTDKVTVGSVAKTYNAAQELNQDMNDPNKISSEESVENIYSIMSYQGQASKETVKNTIKLGIEAGKKQAELNKEIITDSDLGTAYMLGYNFGCKAVIDNEDKCDEDFAKKYQEILMSGLSEQFGETIPTVQ